MSGFYDQGLTETYRFPAATLSSAAVVGRFRGPAGMKGQVVNASYVVTTGVTVAAADVTVGANGQAAPFNFSVPVASANETGAATAAQRKAAALPAEHLAADTTIEVASDGGPTAGAADLIVTVRWY